MQAGSGGQLGINEARGAGGCPGLQAVDGSAWPWRRIARQASGGEQRKESKVQAGPPLLSRVEGGDTQGSGQVRRRGASPVSEATPWQGRFSRVVSGPATQAATDRGPQPLAPSHPGASWVFAFCPEGPDFKTGHLTIQGELPKLTDRWPDIQGLGPCSQKLSIKYLKNTHTHTHKHIYTYTHIPRHIYTHIYICTYTQRHTDTCTHTYIYTQRHTDVHTNTYTQRHTDT